MPTISVLDLAPVPQGSTPADALRNSLQLAQTAEELGYRRYWVAEHHNMKGIASAATSVVIGHIAGGTSTIRVGAGGIMLPNHAPLVIAEQFGTLASLYPGRIDLGLGRAPGTDQLTARALRRTLNGSADNFPNDVVELQHYLQEAKEGQAVVATPGAGTNVPLWILGSSTFGAQLAAALGLPYAFASHFAPQDMMDAIAIYRERFKPSAQLAEPYVMLGYNVFAAESEEEAVYLRSSALQAMLQLRRGIPIQLPPPVAGFEETLTGPELAMLEMITSCSAVGAVDSVAEQMASFLARTGADELMCVGSIYDHEKRLESFRLAAAARDKLTEKAA
jgi:luciferase family oxidoreductase group 1